MALAAGEGLAQVTVRTGDTAAVPPARRAKCRGVCLQVTKPPLQCPIHTPLSPTGCIYGFRRQQDSARAAPHSSLQLQHCRGSVWAHAPHCYPRAAPWLSASMARSPCSATERKICFKKPRPAPPCPHEPVHGDRTPISDNLAVPLFGLSWFSLHDISRSFLSTLNPPAGLYPIFSPPQHKPLAAA